jgi:hypothetical protein
MSKIFFHCMQTTALALAMAASVATLHGQAAATAPPTLQEQLEAQYPLATITTRGGCTVNNVDAPAPLLVQKPGVIAVPVNSYAPNCESNYKDGKVNPPGMKCTGLSSKTKEWGKMIPGLPDISKIPERELVRLEKGDSVYPTRFEVSEKKGEVRVSIGYCSGEGNKASPYKGEVVFHFKGDVLKSGNVTQVEDTIGEVLALTSGNDQDNGGSGMPLEPNALAGQILTHVLQGDLQYLKDRFAANADISPVTTIAARLTHLNHCADNVEVHRVSWRGTPPGYVALGNCDEGRPRLWMILNDQEKISQIGFGAIISNSPADQIQQRARDLVELLAHGKVTEFSSNFAPRAQMPNEEELRSYLNQVTQQAGDFENIIDSNLDLYSDVVIVTCAYQKGRVSFEIALNPALKIVTWYMQAAGHPRYIPQEFQDIQ